MNNFLLSDSQRRTVAILAFLAIFSGFFLSRVLLSAGMIALFSLAVINKNFISSLKSYFSHPVFPYWSAIFVYYILGCFYSQNIEVGLTKVVDKLAFVGLSFGLFCLPKFSSKIYQYLYYAFLFILFLSGIYFFFSYFQIDLEQVNTSIWRYYSSPTNHIRYSLLIAHSIFIAFYFFQNPITSNKNLEQLLLLLAAIFFVVLLHYNAARSGILAFYICALVVALKFLFQSNKKMLGTLLVLSALVLPTIAYFTVDTFKNKINYTIWDYKMFKEKKDLENYSDSKRLIAYEVAFETIKEQAIFGTGTGDVFDVVNKKYVEVYPQYKNIEKLYGSNQFLFILISFGIVGLLLFCLWLYKIFPLKILLNNGLLLAAAVINLVSFIPENTIETQYGIGVFCLSSLMATHFYFLRKEEQNTND